MGSHHLITWYLKLNQRAICNKFANFDKILQFCKLYCMSVCSNQYWIEILAVWNSK